ncbi:terminase [uncultured Prevotella sp.]|uniref:helix-turn-helix domain-containing protein n=1 Tax=uncultured Prevotella sp. TaxID=159272 RepID=UPI0025F262BE|nr:terminase [uncultured Prevotella sp.]
MTKKELEDKKDYARLLYMQGEQQKVIAEKVGVSAQTITKWVNVGGWVEQRAARNITRPELVNKLLRTVDKMIEAVNDSDDPDAANGLGDKLAKFAATIEKLDKHTSIVDVIEVFMAFSKWLQFQAEFDEDITPELLKTINKYHNQYINYLMQNKLINK